jgi:hypothetical protein
MVQPRKKSVRKAPKLAAQALFEQCVPFVSTCLPEIKPYSPLNFLWFQGSAFQRQPQNIVGTN